MKEPQNQQRQMLLFEGHEVLGASVKVPKSEAYLTRERFDSIDVPVGSRVRVEIICEVSAIHHDLADDAAPLTKDAYMQRMHVTKVVESTVIDVVTPDGELLGGLG